MRHKIFIANLSKLIEYVLNLANLSKLIEYVLNSQAFEAVDKGFFESIDDALAEKAKLELHVPEVSCYTQYFNNEVPL